VPAVLICAETVGVDRPTPSRRLLLCIVIVIIIVIVVVVVVCVRC
jgi:hypothetical protein